MKKQQKSILILISLLLMVTVVSEFTLPTHASPDTLTLTPNAIGTNTQFSEVPNAGFKFSDQFESGTSSSWTGQVLTAGETVTVVKTNPHHGIYNLRSTTNAGTSYENAAENYTLPSTVTEIYARIYVNVSSYTWNADNDKIFFIMIRCATGAPLLGGWKQTGGVVKWAITTYTGAFVDVFSTGALPSIKTRYCVELYWYSHLTAGIFRMWVDGVLVCEKIGRSNAYGACKEVDMGVGQCATYVVSDVMLDCAVISSSYIGPENRVSLVNDSSDNTALQVTSNTTEKETMNLADETHAAIINSVTAYIRAKGSGTDNQTVIVWLINSTEYESSPINLTTVFADYSEVRATNPNTTVAWTWSDINALEIGARAYTLETGTIQLSEFYIVIDYTVIPYITFAFSDVAILIVNGTQFGNETIVYSPSDTLNLVMAVVANYTFQQWTYDGASSTLNPFNLTVTTNLTITGYVGEVTITTRFIHPLTYVAIGLAIVCAAGIGIEEKRKKS